MSGGTGGAGSCRRRPFGGAEWVGARGGESIGELGVEEVVLAFWEGWSRFDGGEVERDS